SCPCGCPSRGTRRSSTSPVAAPCRAPSASRPDPSHREEITMPRFDDSDDLRSAQFEGADLSEATFSATRLRQARFVNTTLRGARFIGADLSGVVVRGSDVQGAEI